MLYGDMGSNSTSEFEPNVRTMVPLEKVWFNAT